MTFPQSKTWSQWLSWLWEAGRPLMVDPAAERAYWQRVNNPEEKPQTARRRYPLAEVAAQGSLR